VEVETEREKKTTESSIEVNQVMCSIAEAIAVFMYTSNKEGKNAKVETR
jgi:hypothetical protein